MPMPGARRDGRVRPGWWNAIAVSVSVALTIMIVFIHGPLGISSRRATSSNSTIISAAVRRRLLARIGILSESDLRHVHSSALSPRSFAHARRHRVCMFFDWPPWTRSSLVAYGLQRCWGERHGFKLASYDDWEGRSQAMSTLIDKESPFVAMSGQHMHLSEDELDLMKHACDYRYYVTAARRVEERVFYQQKAELLGSRRIEGATVELTNATQDWIKASVLSGKTAGNVAALERYPFNNQTLGPDYVVRAFYFSDDVWKLFEAFNCTDLLPDASFDVADFFEENAVHVEDAYDSIDIFNFKNVSTDTPAGTEDDSEAVGVDDEPEPSIAPKKKDNGDLFLPETPQDVALFDLLGKGVDSGEITYRKLRGHGYRHNERGLQKVKEVLALRYNQVPDVPIDEEAIRAPKFAELSDDGYKV